MNEQIKTRARIVHKHKTEKEWYLDVYVAEGSTAKRENPFIPLNGELIIFDPDENNPKKRFKFGDGVTNVVELPFISNTLQVAGTELGGVRSIITGQINIDYSSDYVDYYSISGSSSIIPLGSKIKIKPAVESFDYGSFEMSLYFSALSSNKQEYEKKNGYDILTLTYRIYAHPGDVVTIPTDFYNNTWEWIAPDSYERNDYLTEADNITDIKYCRLYCVYMHYYENLDFNEANSNFDLIEDNTAGNVIVNADGTMHAKQVQVDWNQIDKIQLDYIKNKPTLKNSDDSDDSIIFNDLEGSYIGQNMFKIVDIVPVGTEVFEPDVAVTNGKYVLDSVEGLKVGDVVSFKMDYNRYNWSKITAIDVSTKTVSVSKFYNGEKYDGTGKGKTSFEGFANGICTYDYIKTNLINNDEAYLYVINKPTIGGDQASVSFSNALGKSNRIAKAYASTVIGINNLAAGNYCKIIGDNNTSGYRNNILGNDNIAIHGEGNLINGTQNEVKGYYNNVIGIRNKIGNNSIENTIIGADNIVRDNISHASVDALYGIAASSEQTVRGKYNIEDSSSTYAYIFGGGSAEHGRKNIHTLDWNGNAIYSGDITFNGNRSISKELNQLNASVTYINGNETPDISLNTAGVYSIYCTDTSSDLNIALRHPKDVNVNKQYHMTLFIQTPHTGLSNIRIYGNVDSELNIKADRAYIVNADFNHITRKWHLNLTSQQTETSFVDAIEEISFPADYPGALTETTVMNKRNFAQQGALYTVDRPLWKLAHLSPILIGSVVLPSSVADMRSSSESMKLYYNNGEYFQFKAHKDGELYILSNLVQKHCTVENGWECLNNKPPVMPEGYSDWKSVPQDAIVTPATTPYATVFQYSNSTTISYASFLVYAYRKSFYANEQVSVPTPGAPIPSGGMPIAVFVKF